jgi:hypothetical protein
MKSTFLYISISLLIASILFLTSCEEKCTLSVGNGPDTTTTLQQKNVLLEEFTGVRCVNCPAAHELVEVLKTNNPGRFESVSLHSGFYAVPYPFSNQDFETTETNDLENYLGPSPSYPIGTVDRKIFSGQTIILLDKALWSGLVSQELNDTLKVSIDVENVYNSSTRLLTVNTQLNYLTDVTDAQKINIFILENDIIDPQETPDGVDTFYVHNNILRKVLTNLTGDAITEATTSGSVINKSYSYTLPTGWNADNCKVLVFVCANTVDKKDVLQVVGEKVK